MQENDSFKPDTPPLKPDASSLKPDTSPLKPDASPLKPDKSPLKPDKPAVFLRSRSQNQQVSRNLSVGSCYVVRSCMHF